MPGKCDIADCFAEALGVLVLYIPPVGYEANKGSCVRVVTQVHACSMHLIAEQIDLAMGKSAWMTDAIRIPISNMLRNAKKADPDFKRAFLCVEEIS